MKKIKKTFIIKNLTHKKIHNKNVLKIIKYSVLILNIMNINKI